MSTISTGTTITTGYVVTSDTTGQLVIKTGSGAGTTAMTIDASQNVSFNNPLAIGAGSAAAPSIAPTGDSNTGIFFPAADTIAFSEGGVESMRINSSGNVGIGVSPSTKLDVAETSRYTFNVGNAYTLQTSLNAAGSAFADDYKNALSHIWQTSGTERMRIDSSGQVGVGFTPYVGQGSLQTYRTVVGAGPATSGSTDTSQVFTATATTVQIGYGAYADGTGWLQQRAGTNYAVNYSLALQPNGGNVAIGTGNAAYGQLVVQKASSTTDGPVLTLWNSNANAGNTCGYLRFFSNATARAEISSVIDSGGPFAGNFIFKTGENTLTERMRITSTGNVGIGTSSTYGSARLSVAGSVIATGGWDGTNSSAGKLGGIVQPFVCERSGTGAAGQVMSFGNGSSTGKGLRMPFAGRLLVATLAGTGIDGTITIDVYKNGATNTSYRLTATNVGAADVGVTQNWSGSPLTFAAGDTIGWYITTAPTLSNAFNVSFYVIFD